MVSCSGMGAGGWGISSTAVTEDAALGVRGDLGYEFCLGGG